MAQPTMRRLKAGGSQRRSLRWLERQQPVRGKGRNWVQTVELRHRLCHLK